MVQILRFDEYHICFTEIKLAEKCLPRQRDLGLFGGYWLLFCCQANISVLVWFNKPALGRLTKIPFSMYKLSSLLLQLWLYLKSFQVLMCTSLLCVSFLCFFYFPLFFFSFLFYQGITCDNDATIFHIYLVFSQRLDVVWGYPSPPLPPPLFH